MKVALEGLVALTAALGVHAWALTALERSPPPESKPEPPTREIALASDHLAALAESWSKPPAAPADIRALRTPDAPDAPSVDSASAPPPPPPPRAVPPPAPRTAPAAPRWPQIDTASDTPPPESPIRRAPQLIAPAAPPLPEAPQIDTASDAPPPPEPPELSPRSSPAPRARPQRPRRTPPAVEPAPLVIVETPAPLPAAPAPPPQPQEPEIGEILTVEEFFAEQAPVPVSEPVISEPFALSAPQQAAPAPAPAAPAAPAAPVIERIAPAPEAGIGEIISEDAFAPQAIPAAPSSSEQVPVIGETRAVTTGAAQSAPAPSAPAPAPIDPAPQPAPAPSPAPGPDVAALRAGYGRSLSAVIESRKTYPRQAQRRRKQGVAEVRFTVDRTGRVLSASLARSSGEPLLDRAALALIEERIGRFPPPPPGLGDALAFVVPIAYRLQ